MRGRCSVADSKHTPTPWKVDTSNLIYPRAISTVYGSIPILRWNSFSKPQSTEAIANAELIVRAVNHHRSLMNAVEELINAHEAVTGGSPSLAYAIRLLELAKA